MDEQRLAGESLRRPLAGLHSLIHGSVSKDIDVSDKTIVSLLRDFVDKAKQAKRGLIQRWITSIAHTMGKQNLVWDTKLSKLKTLNQPRWRVRHVVNFIGTMVQRMIAKMTKIIPRPEIVPLSSKDEDVRKAKHSQRVCTALTGQFKLSKVFRKALIWAMHCSQSHIKVTWDKHKGRFHETMVPSVDPDGTPAVGEDGQPAQERKIEVFEGDLDYEILNPMTLHIAPGAKTTKEAKWAIHAESRPINWVAENYPDLLDKVKEHQADTSRGGLHGIWDRVKRILRGNSDETEYQYVETLEFWHLPDPLAKQDWLHNGMFVRIIGGQIAEAPIAWPYPGVNRLPFIEFTDGFLEGIDEMGPTMVAQLIMPSRVYNRLWSICLEAANLMGRPKVAIPHLCGVNKRAFTSEPGEKVYFNSGPNGEKPFFMQPPRTHPQQFKELMDRSYRDTMDVSAQHEVSQGRIPPGVTAGVAIDLLQESDETILGPMTDAFEGGVEETYRYSLDLYRIFVPKNELRKMPIYEDDTFGVIEFSGDDLGYFSVHITPGSLKPVSRSAIQSQTLALYREKLFGPYDTEQEAVVARKVLRALDLGNLGNLWEEASRDKKKAQWENDRMDKGIEAIADFYEDHVEHMRWHYSRMKSVEFAEFPQEVHMIYYQHCATHKIHQQDDGLESMQIQSLLEQMGGAPPGSAMGTPTGAMPRQPPTGGQTALEQDPTTKPTTDGPAAE